MAEFRVLVLTPDFPPAKGGIQLLIERLAANLPSARVRVVTLGQDGGSAYDQALPYEVVRSGDASADRRRSMVGLAARALVEARSFRPHVVLSGHVVASLAAIALQRLRGVPFVQYVHADEFRGRGRLAANAVARADATVAVSAYTAAMATSAGAPSDRVHVIHPGIDLPPLARVEKRRTAPTILTVARIQVRYKGHDVIARALPGIRAELPEVRWVVIGDGDCRGEVEAVVAEAGVADAVQFLGRASDDERDAWLDRADVFCMPSRIPEEGIGGEGFGIVYLEAGAHGLPAVAGDVAGARDAVVDGRTGLLVDPTDPAAVATALTTLLIDGDRAASMGAAARNYAEEHAWPLIGARVEELLRTVVSAR